MAKMKKVNKKPEIKTWWVIVAIVLILALWVGGTFNSLVSRTENVDGAWAQVETQYQRRADLIPNLVSTVQGFTNQEEKILLGVTEARSAWTNSLASGSQGDQIQAAQGMDSALARLLVTVEAYPDLKSNQNFLALQDELAGTENRVATERKRFNDAVRSLNVKVKRFPSNMIANMFGFEEGDYFEADAGTSAAPQVEF